MNRDYRGAKKPPPPPPPPPPRSVTGRPGKGTINLAQEARTYIKAAGELRRQNTALREAIITLQARIDFLTKKQLKQTEEGNKK